MIPLADARPLWFLINRFLRPYWKLSVALVFLGMLGAILASMQPLVIAPAMDATIGSATAPAASLRELTLNNLGRTMLYFCGIEPSPHSLLLIVATALVFVVVATLASLLQYASYLLSAHVATSAQRDLQVELARRLMSLSISFFVRQRTGDIVSRVTNDTAEVVNSLDLSLRKSLQSGVQIAVYGVLLFRTAPPLAFATLGVSLVHLVITRLLRDKIRTRTSDRFDAVADIASRMQEALLSIRVIKSFSAERFETGRLTDAASLLQRRTMMLAWRKHAEEPMRATADAVAIGTVLLLSFHALQTGALNMPGFVLFVFLARQTIAPASLFAQSLLGLQVGLGAARRVLGILGEQPQLADGSRTVEVFDQTLRLENVSFEYVPGVPVLKGIDLEIRKGDIVAIVGHSGAGKSTLSDLILRLYDPTTGRVTMDGVDVREFRQDRYRRLFGVVSQECLLFNATLRDNIAYGRPTADAHEIVRAAQIANAVEFIDQLADGYDTMVGDRGIRLSGGQRQRIAIARAVFGSPSILVLDEATSSLDTESERVVQAAIDAVLEQMTAVVIAHRLSTIVKADKIVVLESGRIEAVGCHRDLLERSPTYRRLNELQFGSHRDTDATTPVLQAGAADLRQRTRDQIG